MMDKSKHTVSDRSRHLLELIEYVTYDITLLQDSIQKLRNISSGQVARFHNRIRRLREIVEVLREYEGLQH